MDKLVYNAHEVSKVLNIGMNKVYELISQGKIPHVKVGRKYIIPKEALENWLKESAAI
jgi:excisionase family DNA binding protein